MSEEARVLGRTGKKKRTAQMRLAGAEGRFWAKVQKGDGCWLWTGAKNPSGYGQFSYNGLPMLAHRVSLNLSGTPVGRHDFACHKCDVRACVRPDHLYVGTPRSNSIDMVTRGRGANQKIPITMVNVVRRLRAEGVAVNVIARAFEVHHAAITQLLSGETWAHVETK
jgi:hypothetical protein